MVLGELFSGSPLTTDLDIPVLVLSFLSIFAFGVLLVLLFFLSGCMLPDLLAVPFCTRGAREGIAATDPVNFDLAGQFRRVSVRVFPPPISHGPWEKHLSWI